MLGVRDKFLPRVPWTFVWFLAAGCADILGLHQGQVSGACESDVQCATGEACTERLCLSKSCKPDEKRCNGLHALHCNADSEWDSQLCDAICTNGECGTPKSCGDEELSCTENDSCCKSIEIAADTFELRYTYLDPASDTMQLAPASVTRKIRRFALDRFEVTVGRFRQFVWAYNTLEPPRQGDGAHPGFPASGWQSAWNADKDRYPGSQAAVEGIVRRHGAHVNIDEDPLVPIRGVNWYLALAFCIWDDARLPTEAEWAYAAFGGKEYREYPWKTDLPPLIEAANAQYASEMMSSEEPAHVGAHSAGRGAFEHEDLAGNLEEWVTDLFRTRLPSTCPPTLDSHDDAECLGLEGTEDRVTRGGSYRDTGDHLRNTYRSREVAVRSQPWIGFRCARDLAD
jgi:sulfatase modifying factor 1